MRIGLFLILGVFLWAGTVSIKYTHTPSKITATTESPCADQSHGDRLLAYLKIGTISSIQDNGEALTIRLSPKWQGLTPHVQKQTYNSVVCYAKSQHRPFRFLLTQHM